MKKKKTDQRSRRTKGNVEHDSTRQAQEVKGRVSPEDFYQGELLSMPPSKGVDWVDGGLCPFHSDTRAGNFRVNLTTGAFNCFACDAKGGDVIAYTQLRDGCTFNQAIKKLDNQPVQPSSHKNKKESASLKSASNDKAPITPIPAQVNSPPAAHPQHGPIVDSWVYRDSEGRSLCHVVRCEPKGKTKQFLPQTWGPNGWQWKGLPAPRPLYNQDKLAGQQDALVLVCEGEKAADAAAKLFPKHVITTSLNGSKAAAKTDWSPLAGRNVYIWPDADKPGAAYAEEVSQLAYKVGAISVSILNPQAFSINKSTGKKKVSKQPAGWDAADAVVDGWTAEEVVKMDKNGDLFRPVGSELVTEKNDKLPRFELKDDGVYYLGVTKDFEPARPLWICSRLLVTAYTRNETSEDWGRLLEFPDRANHSHQWAMPMNLLAGSGEGLRSELLRMGLEITTHQRGRPLLGDYVQNEKPKIWARCVTRTGWHGGVFVFPGQTFGETEERFVFQSESMAGFAYREQGTLDEWRREVAALCAGNSRLVFAVCVGFATLLLGLVDDESGGFHYRGDSSTGKTTALRVAASLFGGADYMQRWRMTDNGLESLAEQHNDTLLILDELAQLDPKAAGETAYMLANGTGKVRSDRRGTARPVKRWRLLFLSAGEVGLAEHMAEVNKRAKAGQQIRMADIPADAGSGMGLFENLHGYADGAVLSRALTEAAEACYGVAAPAFIQKVISKRHELPGIIKRARADFVRDALQGIEPSGQALRVAARFGLVAAAGELATALGITGWEPHEAEHSAMVCFRAWLELRGGAGNLEETTLLRQVKRFFELHGEGRFSWWDRAMDSHGPSTSNRAGFVRKDTTSDLLTYYVLPEVFRREICDGYDYQDAERVLSAHGWINQDSEDRAQHKVRLPGYGGKQSRCYVMAMSNMEE